jgi:hypothetical protein
MTSRPFPAAPPPSLLSSLRLALLFSVALLLFSSSLNPPTSPPLSLTHTRSLTSPRCVCEQAPRLVSIGVTESHHCLATSHASAAASISSLPRPSATRGQTGLRSPPLLARVSNQQTKWCARGAGPTSATSSTQPDGRQTLPAISLTELLHGFASTGSVYDHHPGLSTVSSAPPSRWRASMVRQCTLEMDASGTPSTICISSREQHPSTALSTRSPPA